ncbi:MAG: hydrogenase formation protein HypD [Planctomycetes bacterium]|nr:hydrogenase formation protein HypD [Planctomycetota bacterium]
MTRLDTWSDPSRIARLQQRLMIEAERLDAPVTFMEVCGTHTHAISAAGLRNRLPNNVRLISGPGCPVCVTPVEYLDHALALAELPDVTIATFGDLVRVPASRRRTLGLASANGASVHVVYSPRDALDYARVNPDRRVVFLAVGFETTTPAIAATVLEAERDGISNFLVLAGGKRIEPALRALLADEVVHVDGFVLPGHVSVVLGSHAYGFLADECRVHAVVTGFSPVELLLGLLALVRQCLRGESVIENVYSRAVTACGNLEAQRLMDRVFEPADTSWRGLGWIDASGVALRAAFAHRDASRISVEVPIPLEPKGCCCGEVLRGAIVPTECPLFGRGCDPDQPIGACMVSSEGTCAAWYRHERFAREASHAG